jgi:putative FmdB family regulatory protein
MTRDPLLHHELRSLMLEDCLHILRKEVAHMPTYEYKCLDCGKEAELSLRLQDHESGSVACPSCKSKRMEQLISSVMAKTSRKS